MEVVEVDGGSNTPRLFVLNVKHNIIVDLL